MIVVVVPAYLLRESWREGKKIRKRTLANLSSLSVDQIEAIRRVLRGEKLAAVGELFEVTASRIHGDTDAVLAAMRRLGIRELLSSRPSFEAEVVMGMIASRVVAPYTKLATTRWWRTRTLPQDLSIEHATDFLPPLAIGPSRAERPGSAIRRRPLRSQVRAPAARGPEAPWR